MKKLAIAMMVLAFGLLSLDFGEYGNSLAVGIQSADAAKIKTRGKCASAKKQYKSYNRALKRQLKDLDKAHHRIYKVSPNRIVGYTQEVLNKANGVTQAAKNLKAQAAIIQRECVEEKQMDEPLI